MKFRQEDIDKLVAQGAVLGPCVRLPSPSAPEPAQSPPKGRSGRGGGKLAKYGNRKTEVDGILFDSKLEADRYSVLKLMERAGIISDLEAKTPACVFRLEVNGIAVGKYVADFVYMTQEGEQIVEDTKSKATMTPVYRLKKKLMKAIHNIDISEVTR